MKQIEIAYHPRLCNSLQSQPDLVIVVDILRATSTLPVMLKSGASKIYPVVEIDQAEKFKKQLNEPAFLCGERDGKKIEGFDFGNSPAEFLELDLTGKSLIMSSTNGTPAAVCAAKLTNHVIFSSFINQEISLEYIDNSDFNNLLILNSGTKGTFSLEDSIFAGKLVNSLIMYFKDIKLTDSCYGSMIQYNYFKDDIRGMLNITRNGRILRDIGHDHDLDFCAKPNSIPILPVLSRIEDRIVITQ